MENSLLGRMASWCRHVFMDCFLWVFTHNVPALRSADGRYNVHEERHVWSITNFTKLFVFAGVSLLTSVAISTRFHLPVWIGITALSLQALIVIAVTAKIYEDMSEDFSFRAIYDPDETAGFKMKMIILLNARYNPLVGGTLLVLGFLLIPAIAIPTVLNFGVVAFDLIVALAVPSMFWLWAVLGLIVLGILYAVLRELKHSAARRREIAAEKAKEKAEKEKAEKVILSEFYPKAVFERSRLLAEVARLEEEVVAEQHRMVVEVARFEQELAASREKLAYQLTSSEMEMEKATQFWLSQMRLVVTHALRARVSIELSKEETKSKELAKARKSIDSVIQIPDWNKIDYPSIELAVCREMGVAPRK